MRILTDETDDDGDVGEAIFGRLTPRRSPVAARLLLHAIDAGCSTEDEALGATDCPEGCLVEPDGECPHGYESAALTAGVI